MKRYKDGWHKIAGYEVYMEDGYIVRGTLGTGVNYRSAYVYRWCGAPYNAWVREDSISPDAFRAAVKRGTVKMA